MIFLISPQKLNQLRPYNIAGDTDSDMSHAERQANAVGGRTARACDGCIRRRARWYCPADDAFLCQACDTSVHSANPLARRHDRVRLKTSSSSSASLLKSADAAPAWHQGFTRKARTPRHHHHGKTAFPKAEPLVPDLEMSGDDNNVEEEQLLYRVPIFDPVLAEFCSPPDVNPLIDEGKPAGHLPPSTAGSDGLAGFNSADMELAEFAADVESLLGQGVDDDQFCIEGLGLLELREGDVDCSVADSGRVKTELDAEGCQLDIEMELSRETMDINFDYASASTVEEFEMGKVEEPAMFEEAGARRFTLSLDHDAVIAACSSLGCSPWTDGMRPQLNLDDWWPDYMGMWGGGGAEAQEMYGEVGRAHGVGDGGREARVTRYREKRRTRLFSKKIRYEVRKLNAEKRPRMKGRFVKRASFQPAAVPGFPY